MNKIPKLREPRGPIVQQVRDGFIEREYLPNPADFYEQDIRMVQSMDFIIQRCVIMQRKNVEQSIKMLASVLRWRKERRLYDLVDTSFPQELYCGAVFIYEPDKFGNRTIYMRASMCKNCSELKAASKDFLSYLLFKLDDPREGTTFALIMDLSKAGWSNYDLDLLMHILALLKEYFPVNLDYVLAVNFPWILSTAWTLIKRLIPAEKRDGVQFINSDKIFDFIEPQNCPDFLGGTCTKPYVGFNEQAPTTVDYLLHKSDGKITTKRLNEILELFRDVLPETQVAKLKHQLDQVKAGTLKSYYDSSADENNNEADTKAITADDNNNCG